MHSDFETTFRISFHDNEPEGRSGTTATAATVAVMFPGQEKLMKPSPLYDGLNSELSLS